MNSMIERIIMASENRHLQYPSGEAGFHFTAERPLPAQSRDSVQSHLE